MSREDIVRNVERAVDKLLDDKGYVSPVDLYMEIGVLKKADYEQWRKGKIPYLEKVCAGNLNKLSFMLRTLRIRSLKKGCKPSVTVYKQWGSKETRLLRFSKYGNKITEKIYSTHFVKS